MKDKLLLTMPIPQIQSRVAAIEGYLRDNSLYYGMQPQANGDSSWTLSPENHRVTPEQEKSLTVDFPQFIKGFHDGTGRLLHAALKPGFERNPKLLRLNRHLTAGVPTETQELWAQAASSGQKVFSSRPDMVIDPFGRYKIIEYNTDGGADKGNTQGVNDYAREVLGEEILGGNLAQVFVDTIREYHPNDTLVVATVLPNNYRKEYEFQNRYFANQADRYGIKHGIRWLAAGLSDVEITGSGVFVYSAGQKMRVDVIDREFKLPGFTPHDDYTYDDEVALVKEALEGKVDMLGSILPFMDKVLFSTLFDEEYKKAFDPRLYNSLQDAHKLTHVLDESRDGMRFGSNTYTFDDLADLRPEFGMVLKRGGDNIGTTGSKGVVISNGNPYGWKKAFEEALLEPSKGGSFWVVQQFQPSAEYPVTSVRNSRSKPFRYMVINRFAPYYVASGDGLKLGNILVTAGTDEETLRKNSKNIHGLKGNSYQAVSVQR